MYFNPPVFPDPGEDSTSVDLWNEITYVIFSLILDKGTNELKGSYYCLLSLKNMFTAP